MAQSKERTRSSFGGDNGTGAFRGKQTIGVATPQGQRLMGKAEARGHR